MDAEGIGHRQPFGLGEADRRPRRDGAAFAPGDIGRQPQQRQAVVRSPPDSLRRARYHSSMVNSGACSRPRSRLRKTRANSKIFVSPAASSFLAANSGEVCR